MVATVQAVTDRFRRRVSSVLLVPAPRQVDDALLGAGNRGPGHALASAPPGSGLQPVPGDYGLPFVGHVLESIRFGEAFGRRRYERYGPVSWIGAFGTKIVTVAGPDATQQVLINKDKVFSQDGWAFLIDKFFHRGLMLLDFSEHHMHRKIMQQAFTRDRLAGYVDQMVPQIRQAVPQWPTGGSFRLYWALKQLTLDVAARVFMDEPSGASSQEINRAFVAAVRAPTGLVRSDVPGTRWRAGLRGRARLERYFASNLAAKRAGDGGDLFTALCHATTPEGERFTDADVVNHMIFLMMAAHDTSTITTTAAAYFLGKNPDWQEHAREESLALGDEPPDIEALDKLETLDLVIKESLRLVAPVPSLARRALRDTEVLGHHIPAGTLVSATPGVNHFVPECWSDPDRFDPERFAEPRREDRSHRFAWIPFGGGAHKCIGMHFGTLEVKALLHEMLRGYRWQLPDGYHARWDHTSLPVPYDGLPMQLSPR